MRLGDICGIYYLVAATCVRGSHICKVLDITKRTYTGVSFAANAEQISFIRKENRSGAIRLATAAS